MGARVGGVGGVGGVEEGVLEGCAQYSLSTHSYYSFLLYNLREVSDLPRGLPHHNVTLQVNCKVLINL